MIRYDLQSDVDVRVREKMVSLLHSPACHGVAVDGEELITNMEGAASTREKRESWLL